MNFEIIFVFTVLVFAVYLFVTEKLLVDMVALLVMALLLVRVVFFFYPKPLFTRHFNCVCRNYLTISVI